MGILPWRSLGCHAMEIRPSPGEILRDYRILESILVNGSGEAGCPTR